MNVEVFEIAQELLDSAFCIRHSAFHRSAPNSIALQATRFFPQNESEHISDNHYNLFFNRRLQDFGSKEKGRIFNPAPDHQKNEDVYFLLPLITAATLTTSHKSANPVVFGYFTPYTTGIRPHCTVVLNASCPARYSAMGGEVL